MVLFEADILLIQGCNTASVTNGQMKPLNVTTADILNKPALQSLGHVYDLIMHCLAIIALYTPLVWYVLHLRSLYPGNTSIFSINLLQLLIVIALLIAPLLVLRKLGINIRGKEDSPPEY